MSRIKEVLVAAQGWLTPGTAGGLMPGLLETIDSSRVARMLELDRLGAERGRRDLPRVDQGTYDDVEQRVIQEINDAWTLQKGQVIGTLKALCENVARFSIAAQLAELRLAASNAIACFTGARQEIKGELSQLRDGAISALDELRDFRTKHELRRPPRNVGGKWTTFGLLFPLVVFESVLNGFFLATGSETGLFGGVGTALGISAFNVALCFITGLWPARYVNIRFLSARVAGAVATTIIIIAVLALHLFAAHYRDAMAAVGQDQAYAAALTRLLHAPTAVADLHSWYLFGLGALFALLAFWKGYRFDDPYPGYGPVCDRARKAETAYGQAYHDLFGELADVRNETVDRFATTLSNMPVEAQQAEAARMQAMALIKQFGSYEDHLEECANSLLSTYREANRAARTTPAPARFEERWTLRPRTDLGGTGAASAQPAAVDAVLTEIRQLHDDVLQRYQQLVSEADHPASLRERSA